jgi:peptidoglycan/LPS O-acetylase OafA/YrhL
MKILFADRLRGIAALMVLISHHYGVFWGKNERVIVANMINAPALEIQTPSYIEWLWKIPHFSWGLCGVAIFFLISGFVIPYSLRKYSLTNFLSK